MGLTNKLNKRITIKRPPGPEDTDEAGQPIDDWLEVTKTWASIVPLNGRELANAQQVNAEVTTRITIRYKSDIDRTMKAIYQGLEFEFLYIIHTGFAKKELQIMCKERQ